MLQQGLFALNTNMLSSLLFILTFYFFTISTCKRGAWECAVIPDCFTDVSCPRNQVYLEDSNVCQTTCESYGMDCGKGYTFSGCGCPKNQTMAPDVSLVKIHTTQIVHCKQMIAFVCCNLFTT